MKALIGTVLIVASLIGFSCVIVNIVYKHDEKRATDICNRYNSTPRYTHGTHGVCIDRLGNTVSVF